MTTPEEIKAEYSSSLADLKFNSKPLINVLTMLAEENSPNAEVIVEAIETHLSKVTTEVKLPILYLIDCIVKNVGGTYTTLFSQNIVSTFCGVFKAVDEKTRAEMFKLRQTWNDVFPPMKLYAIDVQINLLDPAWPVTAKPPPSSIHFNPKFLQKSTPSTTSVKGETSSAPIDKETLLMQEQLIQKQKELLELQQKKLELEVLQTKVKLQEQFKGTVPHVSMPVRSQNILLKPEVAKQLVPSLKQKPVGISTVSAGQQKSQNNLNNSRLHTMNASGSKSIRDPRLLKQQQKSTDSNSDVHLGQETSILNNNKVVTNKVGVRKTRSDPRLIINKDDIPSTTKNETNKPIPSKSHNSDTEKKSHKVSLASPRSSGDTSSTKSSSNSSLDSPVKNKNDRLKSSVKPKKKDKSDIKILSLSDQNSDKSDNIESSTFKGVKGLTKNRNYVRRNLKSSSPEPTQDEDLRPYGPSEKQSRLQSELSLEKNHESDSTTTKGMDVDLRQLPAPVIRKRPSSGSPEQGNVKKSKTEVLDRLFGNEDTDLRQLPVATEKQPMDVDKSPKKTDNLSEKTVIEQSKLPPIHIDRPPTPPPPIISSNKNALNKKLQIASTLDAVRAKLANATNRANMTFKKKKIDKMEDQDLRVQKNPKSDTSHKIVISPEDDYSIRSGNMTKEQQTQLLQKIIIQMETNKLNEAKKKDHEESLNVLLQPISDEEFIDSDDETDKDRKRKSNNENTLHLSTDSNVISFNDKDERLSTKQLQQKGDYFPSSFYPRDGRDIRRFPGPQNWRGVRGRRGHWENPPRAPPRPWMQQNNWRNTLPNFPHQRPFMPMSQQGPPNEEDKFVGASDTSNDQLQLTNGAVNLDEIKTMIIDGEPKDIRFYDETAVVFVNWDEPKEISFMDEGGRRVSFNDTDSCMLGFNEPYKDVMINGAKHKVRLGAPSREIYIDYVPYECYFGSAGIRIDLNGVSVTVRLEGPPPQVKIGDTKRTDLVAGKINLFINAKIVVPVFLDAKQQKFFIDDETHTLKFVNALQTVLINDLPFEVEYGGIPKPIIINGKKNFIRFSVLPKGIKPGKIRIKDMEGSAGVSPPHVDEASQESSIPTDSYEPVLPVIGNTKRPKVDSPERNSNSPSTYQNLLEQQSLNNLDALSNAMTHSFVNVPTTGGYKVENNSSEEQNNLHRVPTSAVPSVNINDLFQKLVASGFVTISAAQSLTALNTLSKRNEKPSPKSELSQNITSNQILSKTKRNVCDNLKLIMFDKPETLKVCQPALYSYLYSGMQCSSCGMRFSPEASMQYSQHLDWHFRQNRKGKRNIRVAASRKWYYSLSDWKNYEELEDLEEREKNYFDQQQSESLGEEAEEEIEIPSVPADPTSTDECCEVCRDKFDQFFNEEKEEWHLKNAIRVEEKTYHPVCYEDYQKSLLEQTYETNLESSAVEDEKQEEPNIPGLEIIIDDDDEDEVQGDEEPYEPGDVVSLESYDDSKSSEPENVNKLHEEGDDDDVILNEIAPIKIVVDDDDEEYNPETPITDMIKVKKEKTDDGFVEVSGLVSLQNGGQIKIKAEPVDPDEVPLELATSVTDEHLSTDPDVEVVPLDGPEDNFAAHSEMVTSIDGNMEIVSSAPSSVTSSGVSANRIKINISKSLPVILNKEKESAPESGFPSETYIDPSEPFPPGEEPDHIQLKSALKGVNLNKLPPITRGSELTGLCSIM